MCMEREAKIMTAEFGVWCLEQTHKYWQSSVQCFPLLFRTLNLKQQLNIILYVHVYIII